MLVSFIVPLFWKCSYSAISRSTRPVRRCSIRSAPTRSGTICSPRCCRRRRRRSRPPSSSRVIATSIGTVLGALAGYYGGLVDAALMRFTDLVLAVPLLAVLLVLANNSRRRTAFGSRSSSPQASGRTWPASCAARSCRCASTSYIVAARAIGASDRRIIFLHLIPNAAGPIVVNATLTVAQRDTDRVGVVVPRPRHPAAGGVARRLINSGQGAATTEWWLFASRRRSSSSSSCRSTSSATACATRSTRARAGARLMAEPTARGPRTSPSRSPQTRGS